MKIIQYLNKFKVAGLALIALALVTVSCKKSLDTKPITEYSNVNFWNEQAQASAALNGAYSLLQDALNREFIYYGESRSDNLALALENDESSINVINNTLASSMSYTDWGIFYRVIQQANLILKNVPIMKDKGIYGTTNTEYDRVMGQAYGLRALCYFYLVRIWGAVPLLTEPTESSDDIISYQTPRADTLAVYKLISNDLTVADSLLPASYSDAMQTRAQLTKGAIDALFTDYYMWRNNADSALVTSQRVLNNTATYKLVSLADPSVNYFAQPELIDDTQYARMFIDGFSSESIFEIAYNYTENSTSGIYGIYGGTGQAQFNASDTIINKFDLNDLRLLTDFRSDIQVYKFFPKSGFDAATENDKNVILYRLADIMLLRAEALNSTGSRDDAFELVNKIRERAGITAITPEEYNALSTEQAEDYIIDERDRELCFEGKRWFDLVRTGRALKVMGPINGLNDPANILWPISLNVIRENPKIEQNSYYK